MLSRFGRVTVLATSSGSLVASVITVDSLHIRYIRIALKFNYTLDESFVQNFLCFHKFAVLLAERTSGKNHKVANLDKQTNWPTHVNWLAMQGRLRPLLGVRVSECMARVVAVLEWKPLVVFACSLLIDVHFGQKTQFCCIDKVRSDNKLMTVQCTRLALRHTYAHHGLGLSGRCWPLVWGQRDSGTYSNYANVYYICMT